MTTAFSSALRNEHDRLLGQLRELTDLVGGDQPDEERVRAASAALRVELARHMAIEEQQLYPTYERLTGAHRATTSMVADHAEILRRLERLGTMDLPAPATGDGVAELVWGVAALVRAHLDKEERLLLAELERRLAPTDASALLRSFQLDVPLSERLDAPDGLLYRHVQDHLRNEQFAIEGYRQITEGFDRSTYVGYLVDVILEDEQRHHKLFSDLLASIEQREAGHAPAVPDVAPLPELAALRTQLEEYLAFERQDRAELAALAKRLRGSEDDSLWPILIDIMRRDTDKHIHILEFLCRKARAVPQHRAHRLRRLVG